jgi:CDP-diacylglycerol---glycerol-3-phosphate 3-phosphatidyltransferase
MVSQRSVGLAQRSMSLTIYQLKPRFQACLRPLVARLARVGVTANQVTLFACVVSVLIGLALFFLPRSLAWFGLIPVWMFLRMALNAIDGMLAREHGQRSTLGAYLNELTDVLSDAALYLPFARVPPFDPFWVAVVGLMAVLSEMSGLQGATVGAGRCYDGPMGKSDRAFVFGTLGLIVACFGQPGGLPAAWTPLGWLLPAVAAMTAWSIHNRIQSGIRASHERSY